MAERSPKLAAKIAWAELGSLRLRARAVSDGVFAGMHASTRRGSGVEFGGHRAYVPGDDLRLLDRRAMARHDKPFIRELQTETERGLRLVIDATGSMAYGSALAPDSKFAFASLLAAALARIAVASSDPVALDVIGGGDARPVPASSGREAFDRIVASLENARPMGDARRDLAALDRALDAVACHARRGSVVVLFSDLIDLHPDALRRFAVLGTQGRTLLAVRVLDPTEASFPFDGPVRLRAVEGDTEVETDPDAVRRGYLDALAAIASEWSRSLAARGGRLVEARTDDDPVRIVRDVLRAAAEGTR